jgi:predicted metalloprotease with PDZ domain
MAAKKNKIVVTIDARLADSHRLRVTIQNQSGALPSFLSFPVWTPGSYLVREYARHITNFVGAKKISKNTWQVSPEKDSVSYEVYAFEKTVRTSYLDGNYATLVGATILPALPDSFEVKFLFPTHWNLAASALPIKKVQPGCWSAKVLDYDQWIDSPLIAAAPGYGAHTRYRVKGISHELAWVGTECARPLHDITKDCEKICTTVINLFGGAPFTKYVTLLHFGHKLYGGLEHRDSQLSQFDGGALLDQKEYENFLGLFAHEYFHAWNVKSLRPEALGPFDYFNENYTEDLWFAEGLTNYFDELILLQAKLVTPATYWKRRCKALSQSLDGFPAHKRRSLAESSFDTWIRYYRPDEDSHNTDVSYYLKGEQLGLCWDALLQKKSRGRWNLAKLIRAFWRHYGITAQEILHSAKPGYTREDLLNFAEKITKIPQRRTVENWVASRSILPWKDALKTLGIKINEKISEPATHLLGLSLQTKGTAAAITRVYSDSAAERAGLAVGDEILALGDDRCVDLESFNALLKKHCKNNRNLRLTVARLNKLLILEASPRPHRSLGIEIEYLQKATHV